MAEAPCREKGRIKENAPFHDHRTPQREEELCARVNHIKLHILDFIFTASVTAVAALKTCLKKCCRNVGVMKRRRLVIGRNVINRYYLLLVQYT